MGDKPKEDILLAPGWTILIFGDGYMAQSQGGIVKEDNDGNRITELTIKPSKDLRKRYNIKESDLDINGNIQNYQMLEDDLIHLNSFDDANRVCLYVKNYLHEETLFGERDLILRNRLQQERNIRISLEGNMLFLSEQVRLKNENPGEYFAGPLELFKKIQAGTLDAIRNKGEKEDG